MTLLENLNVQRRRLWRLLLTAWIVYTVLFILLTASCYFMFHIHPDKLTKDPVAILKGAFYTGAISNINMLLWAASATLGFCSYIALCKFVPRSATKKFVLHFGLITLVLLLDDLFLWHEEMFPKYIGLHEYAVYAFYLLYLSYILAAFRKTVLKTDYIILIAALCFLGTSMVADIFCKQFARLLPAVAQYETFIEDSLKSIGIFTWCMYAARLFATTVLTHIQRAMLTPNAPKIVVIKQEAV